MTRLRQDKMLWLRSAIHSLAALMLVRIYLESLESLDPGEVLVGEIGEWVLRFLLLSLICSQAAYYLASGRRLLLAARRLLGLWAVGFLAFHILFWFIHISDGLGYVIAEILDSWVLITGLAAMLCLAPLAVTSFAKFRRRITRENWQRLHSLVYVILPIGLLHFYLQIKIDFTEFYVLASVYGACLGSRLWRWHRDSSRTSTA